MSCSLLSLSPVVPGAVVAVAAEVVEAVVPRRPPLEHSRYGSVASEGDEGTWNKERKKETGTQVIH